MSPSGHVVVGPAAAPSTPRPAGASSPLRNRGTPLGEIIADPARGLVYANRGCLHSADGELRRRYNGRRWIACRLQFRGWQRPGLMMPGRFTELFFLDEATAMAAGHRPCALCRREDYREFGRRWEQLHPGQRGADVIDAQLHDERVEPGTGDRRRQDPVAVGTLPDGAFVLDARDRGGDGDGGDGGGDRGGGGKHGGGGDGGGRDGGGKHGGGGDGDGGGDRGGEGSDRGGNRGGEGSDRGDDDHGGEPWLVLGDELLHWTPGGYDRRGPRPAATVALEPITPPSLVELLRTGWRGAVPLLHPSAESK